MGLVTISLKGNIMAHEEIQQYRQRLIDIRKMRDSREKNKAYIELAAEVGASPPAGGMSVGEKEAVYVRNINQALQTATMIDMCKTAAQGYEMATKASEDASIASKSASKQFWIAAGIALFSALAACLSAVASWVAVGRN